MGNTIVVAAVFGPRELQGARAGITQDNAVVNCEVSIAPFSAGERKRRGRGDRFAMELASLVTNSFEQTILTELLPKTQIDIYVQVLQTDGGTRGACINAGMLALADAGIPLRDVVAACSVGLVENTPLLDMNYTEESRQAPCITVALQPNLLKVVTLQFDNKMSVDKLEEMLELASQGAKAIAKFMREKLLENVRQLASARGVASL